MSNRIPRGIHQEKVKIEIDLIWLEVYTRVITAAFRRPTNGVQEKCAETARYS